MHYKDPKQEEFGILQIVIYRHEFWENGKPTGKSSKVDITSIQKCEFIYPHIVEQLLRCPEKYIDSEVYSLDQWHLLTFKSINGCLRLISSENVSESNNEFHRLH